MKAIIRNKYGDSKVLRLSEVAKPSPDKHEVLVKVQAVSINASDCELLCGKPLYARIYGLFKPKVKILGSDIAGQVVAVGTHASKFKPGDLVFGDIFDAFGGFAQYVCAAEDSLLAIPNFLNYQQAAALPQAAVVAWQAIRRKYTIKPGDKVLINGGGGGAGSFAIQLAKLLGAEVTAVDRADKHKMMLAIGADQVIDYQRSNFVAQVQCYDLVVDFVAQHSVFEIKHILNSNGCYVMVGGKVSCLLQVLFFSRLIKLFSKKHMHVLAWQSNTADLQSIIDLIANNKIKPALDRCFPLSKTAQALNYVASGSALGKVVVTIDDS